MTTDIHDDNQPAQPLGLGSSEVLGALVEKLRDWGSGHDEWRVQDPKDGTYCIAFSRGDGYTLDPEREARQWLALHQKHYPKSNQAGFVVALVRAHKQEDRLMNEAADAIDLLLRAEEGAKEAFGVVVQDLHDARKETATLRELLDAAHAQIRRMALRA